MTRFEAATRTAHAVTYAVGALALAATLVPAWRVVALDGMVGLLVGLLNLRMLASALRRGLRLGGGRGKAALSVSGVIRLTAVLALLAWVLSRHPAAAGAWWLVAGVFLPEVVWTARMVRGREPYDVGAGEKGDSA
ncbi:MAG: hypothetical protein K6V97_08715 [Actinomycetia bacterium]|nr:hypothetical protein [Actinomycetes bacterium]